MSSSKKPVVLYALGLGALGVVVGAVVFLFASRGSAIEHELAARKAQLASGPRVQVTTARMSAPQRTLELQAEARPFASVTLYAKVSGYLKDVRVDKGDVVRAGQVLAVIESPELDRQYDAAMADAKVKRANAKRALALREPGVVSAQDVDVLEGQAAVAEATVQALATQKSYETLRAPFDGTVTARFADPGALVQNAANAQTGALPLVTVSQTAKLRVYVYVDQRDAAAVRVGDPADVVLPDTPTQLEARVSRRSDELDPRTRTMLVEVDVDNQDGRIVAGSFVYVRLHLSSQPLVEVPASALIQRNHEPAVAVVADGHVTFRPVKVVEHDGEVVRLAEGGVSSGETVALNLSGIADGARVQPVALEGARPASGTR